MKINGYKFTEEDKKTYIDFLGLCGRIWQDNNENKLCLEIGSSDYPIGQKYPKINFFSFDDNLEPIKIEEIGSYNDLVSKPKKFLK